MENREAYIEKFNAQLKEIRADLDKLDAKARQSEADLKIKYQDQIEDLKRKQIEAQAKLDEIKNSSGDAWQELKAGADVAFENLKISWNNAWEKFKK